MSLAKSEGRHLANPLDLSYVSLGDLQKQITALIRKVGVEAMVDVTAQEEYGSYEIENEITYSYTFTDIEQVARRKRYDTRRAAARLGAEKKAITKEIAERETLRKLKEKYG